VVRKLKQGEFGEYRPWNKPSVLTKLIYQAKVWKSTKQIEENIALLLHVICLKWITVYKRKPH
jgi:hypothetical protein